MASVVQNMLENVIGDGARSSKFEVLFEFTNPASAPTIHDTMVMVKTTAFPSKQHTPINLLYKGRTIPIKGQVKYTQTWECTFHLGQDHGLKAAFENWIEAIDEKHNYIQDISTEPNLKDTQLKHFSRGYTTTINLHQRDFDDSTNTSEYNLYNVFPIEVSPVQASYEAVGTIQEFTVTFAYSYFQMKTVKGSAGNFIDILVGKYKDAGSSFIGEKTLALGKSINDMASDNTGDTLNKLNEWARGTKIELPFAATTDSIKSMVSGGVGEAGMIGNNIFTSR